MSPWGVWDTYFEERYNHGTWMRRAIEEGLVDTAHSIEVGLRGSLYGSDDWTSLRSELGLDYVTTEEVLELYVGPLANAPGGADITYVVGFVVAGELYWVLESMV